MEIITIILLAISLSIDAFTLSIAYGFLSLSNKKILLISILTGICHFIMPLIGMTLSILITKEININTKYILLLMLFMLLIESIRNYKDTPLTNINIILFPLVVSIDSLTIGLGLTYITNKIILSSLIFSITSFLLTLLGFKISKYIKTNKYSKIISIIIILLISVYIICK